MPRFRQQHRLRFWQKALNKPKRGRRHKLIPSALHNGQRHAEVRQRSPCFSHDPQQPEAVWEHAHRIPYSKSSHAAPFSGTGHRQILSIPPGKKRPHILAHGAPCHPDFERKRQRKNGLYPIRIARCAQSLEQAAHRVSHEHNAIIIQPQRIDPRLEFPQPLSIVRCEKRGSIGLVAGQRHGERFIAAARRNRQQPRKLSGAAHKPVAEQDGTPKRFLRFGVPQWRG